MKEGKLNIYDRSRKQLEFRQFTPFEYSLENYILLAIPYLVLFELKYKSPELGLTWLDLAQLPNSIYNFS